MALVSFAAKGSHSSNESRRRKHKQSIKVRVRTACSDKLGSSLGVAAAVAESDCGGGCRGMGEDEACKALSYRRSRRIDGRRGWLLARGDGGAVMRSTVL